MRLCLAVALLLSLTLGCGRAPKAPPTGPNATTTRGLTGLWKGSPQTRGEKSYIAEQLGGYDLRLNEDGQFIADWRGLTLEGTWKRSAAKLELDTKRVMGKDRRQAELENERAKSKVNDLSLYAERPALDIGPGEQTLLLRGSTPGSQTVVFRRA